MQMAIQQKKIGIFVRAAKRSKFFPSTSGAGKIIFSLLHDFEEQNVGYSTPPMR